jgi:hypothetical protein
MRSSERVDELLGSLNILKFLCQLSDYKLLKQPYSIQLSDIVRGFSLALELLLQLTFVKNIVFTAIESFTLLTLRSCFYQRINNSFLGNV